MAPVRLRSTRPEDLDFVLELEHRPDSRDFIGQWPREDHLATMARQDREHLMIEDSTGAPLGYIITYDMRPSRYGVYIKRIAVSDRARGTGRAALAELATRWWSEAADAISLAVRPANERAQRCYRAVGFDEWTLDASGWEDFLTTVDSFATGCLLMRLTRSQSPHEGSEGHEEA